MSRQNTPAGIALLLCSLVFVASGNVHRRPANTQARSPRIMEAVRTPTATPPLHASTVVDTYVVAEYTFEGPGGPDPQGWTTFDNTSRGAHIHVDADTTNLTGGRYGGLVPLEGSQSLWCGIAPAEGEPYCRYATPPGYGNHWNEVFVSRGVPVAGDMTLSYLIFWDIEPSYDRAWVEYRDGSGTWWDIYQVNGGVGYYDGTGTRAETLVLNESGLGDTLRIRFRFRSDGAWSDEDGLWPTDGAFLLDALSVSDSSGVVDYQDFESEEVGATTTTDGGWSVWPVPGYGDFAGLFDGLQVLQMDPCHSNISGLWGFFSGSDTVYACGGHPEQPAVPFGTPSPVDPWANLYMDNEIWSPTIDWTRDVYGSPVPPSADHALLEFDVYRDLPVDNLVLYGWGVSRWDPTGCWSFWGSTGYVYHGWGDADWFRYRAYDPLQYLPGDNLPPPDSVRVSLTCIDMYPVYGGILGTGDCHSNAPLFDNVRVLRLDDYGPTWTVADYALFQDNFASNGTTTGTVRADMALDLRSSYNPVIDPGDSAVVQVSDKTYGLSDAGGPAVYCHVRDVSPAKSGAVISDDLSRWPVVVAADGWTTLRCDSVRYYGTTLEDRYCVDLNDALYTPGDTILYYFSATNTNAETSYWTSTIGATASEAEARANPCEWTCLPANALSGKTDILYVANANDDGVGTCFESAFGRLGLLPDRYDVLDAGNARGNGLGSRVVSPYIQLDAYKTVIWSSGINRQATIGGGDNDKSPDFFVLNEFLRTGSNGPGLYISGDNVTEEWDAQILDGADYAGELHDYMNFSLLNGDHVAMGQPISPLLVARPGSCFDRHTFPDTIVASGGCPVVDDFDVLDTSGAATVAMTYGGTGLAGVLAQVTANDVGDTARVVVSGFSYHHVANDRPGYLDDSVDHLADILRWLNDGIVLTGISAPSLSRNSLRQCYPNPFNPSTTIRFSVTERAHTTLTIYNVAGQRVRVLFEGVAHARPNGYTVTWDGTDDRGTPVAGGVYFCQLRTAGFTDSKKMVLLK